MNILNEGEIIVNNKTRAKEVAQIMVTAGIYDSVDEVPVYEDDGATLEEAGISIHEVYGNIDTALQEIADKCKEAGIILNGQICYSGDYDGKYYITNNEVEDLTTDEIGIREAPYEALIAELEHRGLQVKIKKSETSEFSKPEDLPGLGAYEIKWDTDGDEEILDSLPKEIRIPDGMVDDEEISDYLSNETGFCHVGFKLGIYFRGKIMPCNTNWLDNDTFQMWFGEDIFKDYEGDNYLIKLEKHLKDNEWVVEIIWEDDCTTINRIICNADDYITANEIWKIERICEKMIPLSQNADDDSFSAAECQECAVIEDGKEETDKVQAQKNDKKFIVQRVIDNDLSLSVMTEEELIRYIDEDDLHQETYQIYDGTAFGEMKKVSYAGWQPDCLIELVDEDKNVVLSGYGTNH